MCHRRSSECSIRICVKDDHHAASIHASNCITLHTDLVHMVEIDKIAYSTSWRSRRRSRIRDGEKVGLY